MEAHCKAIDKGQMSLFRASTWGAPRVQTAKGGRGRNTERGSYSEETALKGAVRVKNQTQPRTSHGTSEVFSPPSALFDHQGYCGALTAAIVHTSTDNKGSAAVLATDKSTPNTVPTVISDGGPLQGDR